MKSNNWKYILFVLIAVIAVPASSNIVPLAFAVAQSSDMVTIRGHVTVIPETDNEITSPPTLIPVGAISSTSTIIVFHEPFNEAGNQAAQISDILISDHNRIVCPLDSIDGIPSNVCFMSDNEKHTIDDVLSILENTGSFNIIDIDETGAPQDVSSLLDQPAGYVIVQSDLAPVNPSIPEFPIPFSMIIIFVAVAAVYVTIRQKMIPGFKI